jgi:hypothetical protein
VEESTAEDVVARLRQRRIFANVNRRAGVYNVGVRVVIPDGREAIWDNDGAAGLEAMVLRDGVLVGFVPQIPDSDDLDAAAITEIIAAADYDARATLPPRPAVAATPGATEGAAAPPAAPSAPAAPPSAPDPRVSRSWRDRLRGRR